MNFEAAAPSPLPDTREPIRWLRLVAKILRWGGAISGTIAILILASISLDGLPIPDVPNIDKVGHAIGYFILMILWCLAVRLEWPGWSRWRTLLVLAVLVTLYGIGTEFHQEYFVEGRSFSVWDMVADGVGAALGAVCWWLWERRQDRSASRANQRVVDEPLSPL